MISQARLFMGGQREAGGNACASCGSDCEGVRISKGVKNTFTEISQLLQTSGIYICGKCEELLNDSDMRFKPVLFEHSGEKQVIERERVLELIKDPLPEWVLSVPYSFKKHHWLYAGLSNKSKAYIGTDNRTVLIDYSFNVREAVNTIVHMIDIGIPRKQIISGEYSIFTTLRYPDLRLYEKTISGFRHTGAVELIVTYTPAVKNKIKYETGESEMTTETEKKAITILGAVAKASRYRMENGMQFWDTYFLRRINRYKKLGLNEFLSKLCDAVNTDITKFRLDIEGIENEEEIMSEIRDKSKLLVALAYNEIQKNKKEYE